jgi:hypothetical protein
VQRGAVVRGAAHARLLRLQRRAHRKHAHARGPLQDPRRKRRWIRQSTNYKPR